MKILWWKVICAILGIALIVSITTTAFLSRKMTQLQTTIESLKTEEKEIINHYYYSEININDVYNYLVRCRFKYPDIVAAQVYLESSNLTSDLYLRNNNLIGMKNSGSRITTNINDKAGYARYYNWRESLLDYGFLQISFIDTSSEESYIKYLRKYYAKDPKYVNKILECRDKLAKKYAW